MVGQISLFSLLLLTLARLLRQVVDVILRHQHLNAVHEFFGGPRLTREHHSFFRKVDLRIEFVDRHPILEVAVEPIGFFDEDHAHVGMRPQPGDHFAEGGAAGLLRSLHVHIFLRHRQAPGSGVVLNRDKQIEFC